MPAAKQFLVRWRCLKCEAICHFMIYGHTPAVLCFVRFCMWVCVFVCICSFYALLRPGLNDTWVHFYGGKYAATCWVLCFALVPVVVWLHRCNTLCNRQMCSFTPHSCNFDACSSVENMRDKFKIRHYKVAEIICCASARSEMFGNVLVIFDKRKHTY